MDRRKFMMTASSLMAMLGLGAQAGDAAVKSAPKRTLGDGALQNRKPNVVVMICDDLGYGDLGCYGSRLPTLNLDRMAAEGARFTRWNSAHPICSASRAALLTGRYGVRMDTGGAFDPDSTNGTSTEEMLLSNLFQNKGYATKAVGKWHLGYPRQYLPTSRGFDSYLGVPWSVDMAPFPLIRDTEVVQEMADRDTLTPLFTDEAVRFLEDPQRAKQPFFLYLAYSYPHDAARASARFHDKTAFGHVGDSIAEIDWSVGEIINTLKKQGLADDTLVLFTSDHGPWYQGSPGILRGRKASSWEGGSRVPMIARWPGAIAPGRTVEDWCSHLDVLPTIARTCDLALPAKPLDGSDISSIMFGAGDKVPRKPIIYFSAMGNGGRNVHCIRRDQWKLRVAQAINGEIYTNDRTTVAKGSAWLARPELYNLEEDPSESYDVANLHPKIVADLSRNLEEQIQSFPSAVQKAFTELKTNVGGISTPPGGSPRSANSNLDSYRSLSWDPPELRPSR